MPAAAKKMSKPKEALMKPAAPKSSLSSSSNPAHPSFSTMILNVVVDGGRKGASRPAILKNVLANCPPGDAAKTEGFIKRALKKLIETEQVVPAAIQGRKGSGCFKVAADVKKPKVKSARKPMSKKLTTKKAAKKPTTKKVAAAKKPAAKKVAAAKKTAAKK